MVDVNAKRFIVRGWDRDPDYDGEVDHEYYATEEEVLVAGEYFESVYDFVEIYDFERNRFL